MATVLAEPVCASPARTVAPKPEWCWRCKGNGIEPDVGGACRRCFGGRYEFARFDLAPSRTYGLRRVRFEPRPDGVHVLWVWLVKTKDRWRVAPDWVQYTVCETANDWHGRSFLIDKTGEGRSHNVFIGKGSSCECEARTYETTAKHNQAAWERGEQVFAGMGCIHQDAISALLAGGWFDLPSPKESSDGPALRSVG